MKYFLTTVLLLASVSCATQRQKSKHTERAESSQFAKKGTDVQAQADIMETATVKDSTAVKTDVRAGKEVSALLQNLTLKNSGKCGDGGEIRFLRITDKAGNVTEVPVNDNTELNYSSQASLEKENASLKQELQNVKTENSHLQAELSAKSSSTENLQNHNESEVSDSALDVRRNGFMSYVWTVIITIASVVLVQLYFKIKL